MLLALGEVASVASPVSASEESPRSLVSESSASDESEVLAVPVAAGAVVFEGPVDLVPAGPAELVSSASVPSVASASLDSEVSGESVDSDTSVASDFVGLDELVIAAELVISESEVSLSESSAPESVTSDESVPEESVVSNDPPEPAAPVSSERRPVDVDEARVPLRARVPVSEDPVIWLPCIEVIFVLSPSAVPVGIAVILPVPLNLADVVGNLPSSLRVPVDVRDLPVPSSVPVASDGIASLLFVE
jgi:hypothetical protein